jgi:hypothetical protein
MEPRVNAGIKARLAHLSAYLAPLRNGEWVVYSKRPFGGPEEVLRYLARYTHRLACAAAPSLNVLLAGRSTQGIAPRC